jgi:hypothetical protein
MDDPHEKVDVLFFRHPAHEKKYLILRLISLHLAITVPILADKPLQPDPVGMTSMGFCHVVAR